MKKILLTLIFAAEAALLFAKESPSRLDVTVQPVGAKVFIDGKECGAAPCSLYDITPGRHWVRVEAPNYIPEDDFVILKDGDFQQKTFAMQAERALVLVKTEPAGADVKYHGTSLGTTPLLVTSLAAGSAHNLELSLVGYQTKRIEVMPEGRKPIVREETLPLDSGIVECSTSPSGSTVLVNGVERGITPCVVKHVPKGLATIVFRKAGYKDESREVRLAPGDRQTLAVQLRGEPAKLTVVSTPEGAKVFVDDEYQGKTPTTASGLTAGEHKVRIELAGCAPVTRTVSLENGSSNTEEFRLDSVMGRLEIVTTPPGAKISIDGKAVGTTRGTGVEGGRSKILQVKTISAGKHSVLVHLDGYLDTSRSIVVKPKETFKLFVKLSRVFQANTQIETIHGVHKGVLVEKDYLGNVTLEVSPGVQQTYRAEDIRKITTISK